ncbi:Ribosomal protein S6--L-glutamate ligase [Pseudodesulfovibrio hydrargyri]|uniref:Ribosomal protein S6--L-glutamate ligase n=1 Tax=Pseudodesulfovibrio hydrargyri TaxID=2125990 RepID=A0A1J5N9F1_9BACT|nr:GNAT family N-acetyltransferase [Pseudodesulfovibrio hydrargyri]OIQ52243.1 Ribosomal protein S6--L-glutamate ligase [Pseudodesulfovibrio hydrargyri]
MSLACETPAVSFPSSSVRPATLDDLPLFEACERTGFSENRRASKASLRHSITSPSQLALVIEGRARRKKPVPAGCAVVFQYKRSLRVYSLAILKEHRMLGLGEALVRHIVEFAASHGYERVTLEADMNNPKLVNWYRKFGFEPVRSLPDYYGPAEPAVRMVLSQLSRDGSPESVVIVVDEPGRVRDCCPGVQFCSATDYLADTNYAGSNRFHVLNLCTSYKTHSMGYYVSLLASARNHRVTPSVMTVKDVTTPLVAQSLLDEIKDAIHPRPLPEKGALLELTIILGRTPDPCRAELARKLFSLFAIPFFTIVMERLDDGWKFRKVKLLHLRQVARQWPELLRTSLEAFCLKKRYNRPRLKSYQYDLAILADATEPTPPSSPMALEKFRKAAEKVGFFVEFITKADHRRICEFDALFIRETTAMDNHTYAMSRHAYTEGLVVVDDPWSIMLCSNKVYLQERLAHAGANQPRGWHLTRKECTPKFLNSLPLPLVLKLPESSFSLGVFRVSSVEELGDKLVDMFKHTDLVIAQEFLVSDFDWRVGLLDNKPLFACKYYMANNHWQIYNWQESEDQDGDGFSGRSETIPVDEVPPHILKAAIQASSLIGNGLYGVDLKDMGGKAYVIEVNDNPNVDAGIEDLVLGDELYERIMRSIHNRIEAERHQVRYIY